MVHEFDGRKYEKASEHQKEWGARLIAELKLQGTERALDLGCGDGTITARIADLLPDGEVIGIDASHGMIDAALPKTRGNLRFILMDIDDLDFAGQYDVVFSNAALHWVKDHKRLLHNVRVALRSDGRLRFNFAADGNCSSFFDITREAMSSKKFTSYFSGFKWPWYMPPVDEYSSLVKSSGLREARIWGENADRLFSDADAMIRWIDQPSLVPFLAYIPEQQKTPFRDYVVGRMIEESEQADGRCFVPFRRINVAARK